MSRRIEFANEEHSVEQFFFQIVPRQTGAYLGGALGNAPPFGLPG